VKIPVLLFALLCAAISVDAQEYYGTIKSTTKLRADGLTSTTTVDPDQRTAEETVRDGSGKVLRTTTYTLGERDLPIGAVFADAKGKVIYKASYQRDAIGQVVETTFTGPDDRYLGKRVFVFGGGKAITRVEDYDARGQLIAQAQPGSKPTAKKRR
jgi:hypothetical protein